MDAITAARELGKLIQQSPEYIRFNLAQQKNDDDTELQDKIQKFSIKRMDLNHEIQKQDRDQEKISKIDAELREMHSSIMNDPNMVEYSASKEELDMLLNHISQIINASAQGENPDFIDLSEDGGGCSGSCSGCAGCH